MLHRIAMISEHASPVAFPGSVDSGGQNIYVGQVAKQLAALGYEVDIFTRRDHAGLPLIAEWIPKVRIIHVPAGPATFVRKEDLFPLMDEFSAWMVNFCQRQKKPYDMVHAHFWMSGMAALALKKKLGLPFVMTFHALGHVRRVHQPDADEFPNERLAIEQDLVDQADHLIAECPQDKEDLLNFYNADPRRIAIIPCGFDRAEFWPLGKTLSRAILGLPLKGPLIMHVGRLVPRKGIDNIIRGIACLKRDHRVKALLVVVGGNDDKGHPAATPEIARLLRIAQEEGVRRQVRFVGRRSRDTLRFYYSAADVFVTTPWYEPFGITPLEAMACGTPVIASAVGGLQYSVKDAETGYCVPPKNPKLLGDCLAYYFAHPSVVSLLCRQAIDRVQLHFTWEKVTDAIVLLYAKVIARKTSRPVVPVFRPALDRRNQPRVTLSFVPEEAAS